MNLIPRCLFVGVTALILSCTSQPSYHDGQPSSGAKDMAGAEGVFAFTPTDVMPDETSWWIDSDGVAPGIAGCHIGTDELGRENGRSFGEACLPNGLLVESNPGKGVLHSHTNDVGHPDTFDCNAWCVGEGMSGGSCQAAVASPCQQSAVCECQ
ncbi:hypothetical protein SIN8267_01097 [Sinobacterium norvegicum]|uniref:Lipoprotein n=1 Tax=Sinobacterium norvegicum TaxID=1641715 RepID=A0ABM9ADC1_9GAMM|nr:hypothetical protein [Sinobacterium norvegicum]CAH0990996.1 hypothetical protein SIN8267_01097 [Sinobacterium norvegicum]